MTSTTIFYIIIILYSLFYIYSESCSFLNLKYASHPLPDEIKDLYDEEKRKQQLAYQRVNTKISFTAASAVFVFNMLVICLGGFAWLDNLVQGISDNAILQALLFLGIYKLAQDMVKLPFEIYDTFVIEERFGFNRTTVRTFIADMFKTLGVNIILGGGILAVVVLIYTTIPDWFWLVAWSVLSAFSLFMSLFYSDLIVPLFNKQEPLAEGELRNAIERFAQSVDFQIENIYVMDSSKRSSKANAYFTGWGRRKRIVLYDTLIETLTTDEIVAVLAHEIGHNKNHHIVKDLCSGLLQNLFIFALLGITLKYDVFAQSLGCEAASFHVNTLVFFLLFKPISELLDIVSNIFSRRHEYQADHFVKEHGMSASLISSLKKLTTDNLGNPTPHPLIVFLQYSHPTLYQRIIALK